MKDTPMKATLNCSTGEVTMEPYTAEEVAQMEIDQAASVEREAIEAQKAADAQAGRDALLALGLTEAQINALLGA